MSKSPQFGVKVPVDGVDRWVPISFEDGCVCSSETSTATADVLVAGKQELAFVGRGRLVAGDAVGEPLFAVAEPDGDRVACCSGACEGAGTPNVLFFDKYRLSPAGYAPTESIEYPLPAHLSGRYASRKEHACLPWVRISRDPERFRGCLAQARALGPIQDSKAVATLVGDYLLSQDSECFLVILLDTQLQLRGISEIARGARDKVDVPVPDCLRIAVVDGASGVVVVHNHPSGVLRPSESDKELTQMLKKAFSQIQIDLLDHVIVSGKDKYYSFAKAKKL